MIQQAMSTKTVHSRRSGLCRIGGAAALITGLLLLIGMISLIVSILQPGTANGWSSLFRNNWLVKIFILHAEFSGVHADLQGLNLLDIAILLLVSLICLGFSTAFRNARRVWSIIAFALALIAIILFVTTQIAGRSTVMLAVLINSFLMLGDKSFGKVTVYTGILAGILLFAGDLTVGIHSNIITMLFGAGYVLLTIWFLLIARILFRLGQEQ